MKWRWAKDNWWRPDKLWHFIGGLVSPLILWIIFDWAASWCVLASLAFWWLWEVKDAFVRWEDVGWLGGDGFSWKDGVSSSIGIIIAGQILAIFI